MIMEQEVKYYTPEIEEFHVGFEFEYRNNISDNNWYKIDVEDHVQLYEINADLNKNLIRVKYLDKEDIEELGWNLNTLYNREFKILYGEKALIGEIIKNKIKYYVSSYESHTVIQMYNEENKKYTTLSDNETIAPIFIGTIKNKSELKKLMKQLNII